MNAGQGPNLLVIDPAQLVCAHIRQAGGQIVLRAFMCRYVSLPSPQGATIAIEILYDPANQEPQGVYYAQRARLERITINPADLLRIHPYAG